MKETRVFLGNAPWYKPGYYGVRSGSRWPHFEKEGTDYYPFPFFLAYATALLEREGFPVLLVDAIPQRLNTSVFLENISHFRPDIIVLETSTASLKNDLDLARQIKADHRQSLLILCGAHFLIYNEEFLQEHQEIDVVLRGEYEFSLLEVAEAYEKAESFHHIRGILFQDRQKNTVIEKPPRPLLMDLDKLPWPARSHLPVEKYRDYLCGIPQPSLQMWSSRGCPYHCSFCYWPHLMYKPSSYRLRDPEDVLHEIAHCLEKYSIRSVYFDDDTFNINREHVFAIANGFIDRKWDIPWGIMARADHMDQEMLEILAQSGLWGVKYGIETGSQEIVNRCGKKLDLQKVAHICRLTKQLGIKMHLTFAFGLPGETRDTARQTIDFALAMNPDSVQFSIATPFPGSPFFEEMHKKGQIISEEWEQYDGYQRAVIATKHLTAEELEEIRRTADELFRARDRIRVFYPEVKTRQDIEKIHPFLPKLEEAEIKKKRFRQNKKKYLIKAISNPLWFIKKFCEYLNYRQISKKTKSLFSENKR